MVSGRLLFSLSLQTVQTAPCSVLFLSLAQSASVYWANYQPDSQSEKKQRRTNTDFTVLSDRSNKYRALITDLNFANAGNGDHSTFEE